MDPRASAYFAARDCLRTMGKQKIEDPEFWANLLGAVANASVAAVPDSVMEDVMVELARQEHIARLSQKTVQRRIREDLADGQ